MKTTNEACNFLGITKEDFIEHMREEEIKPIGGGKNGQELQWSDESIHRLLYNLTGRVVVAENLSEFVSKRRSDLETECERMIEKTEEDYRNRISKIHETYSLRRDTLTETCTREWVKAQLDAGANPLEFYAQIAALKENKAEKVHKRLTPELRSHLESDLLQALAKCGGFVRKAEILKVSANAELLSHHWDSVKSGLIRCGKVAWNGQQRDKAAYHITEAA